MNLRPIPLFGLGNQGKSVNVDAQKRTNLYCQLETDPEKNVLTMYPTPGLTTFVNFGANPDRAFYVKGDFQYHVNGGTFWRVSNDGTMTNLGTLLTTGGRCDISDNGFQIMVVDGTYGYIYTLVDPRTISTITRVGTLATLTTVSDHGLTTGMQVTVSGALPAQYNGTYTVTVLNSTQYTYTMASDPGSSAAPVGSYVITSGFVRITDPDFPGATTVTFLNGYFVVSVPNSAQFNISALYDGSSWDALDFATAESDPDNLVRVMAENGQLVLFGEKTTEFWGDSGAADFPFARIGASAIEWGLAARWSLTKYMDSLVFLRRNRLGQVQVCALQGYSATALSSPEMDYNFSQYGAVEDATAFSYMLAGHPFYVINFPTGDESWQFDGQSKSWSRRMSGEIGRYRGEMQANYLNRSYVSDATTGKIYLIDEETYTEDGETIVREWISRHQSTGDYSHFSQMWIEMEAGVGLVSGQGENPKIMMSISRDGGHTWGAEIVREFGKIGEYRWRAVFNRLGRSRDWLYKFRVTDPVPTVFVAAWGRAK